MTAARVLLIYQTPAETVPEYPECVGQQDVGQRPGPDTDHQAHTCGEQSITRYEMQPGVDQHWQHKYHHHLWFHFTPAMLSAWYTERYDPDDMIEFDKSSMANADVIGRPERTPSLGGTKDR